MKTFRKTLFTALLLGLYVATAGNTQGCGVPISGEAQGKKFQTIIDPLPIPKGEGPIDELLGRVDLNVPFKNILSGEFIGLDDIDEVYLNEIGVRSVVEADNTAPKDNKGHSTRLGNPELIAQCDPGQAKVDFVESLELWISKVNNQGGIMEPVMIANYKRGGGSICGFFLVPTINPATGKAYNLRNFLPDYKIHVTGKGVAPSALTLVGGYVAVDVVLKF